MSFPLVDLFGNERLQGRGHGEALRDRARQNRDVYFERFETDAGVAREDALSRARAHLAVMRDSSPTYVAGMEGIAEGAHMSLEEVVALNVRYEILYDGVGKRMMAEAKRDGCTGFVLMPEVVKSGRLLSGQNWDWIPEVQGAVLRVKREGAPDLLGFTEAGIFGVKLGLNAAAVSLTVNGMLTVDDDGGRPERPFHLRCHDALRARSLDEARSAVAGTPRACAVNFLLSALPNEVADMELGPKTHRELSAEDGVLVHANHFVDQIAAGVEEPSNPRRHLSEHRHARLEEILRTAAPLNRETLMELLRDHDGHPNSVCRHPDAELPEEQRVHTVCGAIMEPGSGSLWITDGPPCEAGFEEFRL